MVRPQRTGQGSSRTPRRDHTPPGRPGLTLSVSLPAAAGGSASRGGRATRAFVSGSASGRVGIPVSGNILLAPPLQDVDEGQHAERRGQEDDGDRRGLAVFVLVQ